MTRIPTGPRTITVHRIEVSYKTILAVALTVGGIWLVGLLMPILGRAGHGPHLAGHASSIRGLAAMVGYQEFESRMIVPSVYGHALRLSSAVVVIALFVGGKLGGIVGALLALPIAAALRMLIEELRVDLPGDDTDDAKLRARDARAERKFQVESAGATPEEAAALATDIAGGSQT